MSDGLARFSPMSEWFRFVVMAAVLAAVSACGGATGEPAEYLFQGSTMGTRYTVKIVGVVSEADRARLSAEIASILARVNKQMSTYMPDSELSRFNQSRSTDWVAVSQALVRVVEEAQRTSRLAGGAFDVTVGPLVNLWGFGPTDRADVVPSDQAIRDEMRKVGYAGIHTRPEPPALKKDIPNAYVDLSAIAKGYGVDRLAEYLESNDIVDYMVEIGGEIRGRGKNGRGVAWRIGVETPSSDQRAVTRVIQVDGAAVATSGDYRNYFERDGVRFAHTIDPHTGRPVTHSLASVTVIERSAMRADALATAFMVLGPREGMALAEREQLAALFIVKQDGNFVERQTLKFADYALH